MGFTFSIKKIESLVNEETKDKAIGTKQQSNFDVQNMTTTF